MNSILAVTYSFFLSFIPLHDISVGNAVEKYQNATKTELEIGLDLFDCVHFYAGEGTWQVPDRNIFNWQPYTQRYYLGVEYHKDINEKLQIKVGLMHSCQHAVESWQVKLSEFNEAYTQLYVGFKGKVNLF